jgi:hypothetical protein
MESINKKKEYDKVYFKQYYEKNKDYWKQKTECGILWRLGNRARPMRTNKHQKAADNNFIEGVTKMMETETNEGKWKELEVLLKCVTDKMEEIKQKK